MAELTPPRRHGHWCFSRRIDAHGIVKEYSDAHTRAYVRLWWTHHRSWMRKFSEGVLLTEQLQLPKITTVISPGCLIMVAKKKAAISYVIFGETGYSVKHSGWGWPHMLRLHAGSCRCHNISAGWLPWRDGDILLPWGNNPVLFHHLNMLFFLLCCLLLSCVLFSPSSFFPSFFPFFALCVGCVTCRKTGPRCRGVSSQRGRLKTKSEL